MHWETQTLTNLMEEENVGPLKKQVSGREDLWQREKQESWP